MEKLLPLLCKWFQFHKEKASGTDCTLAGPFRFTKASLIHSHVFFPAFSQLNTDSVPDSWLCRPAVLLCGAVRLSDMTPHCQREWSEGDPKKVVAVACTLWRCSLFGWNCLREMREVPSKKEKKRKLYYSQMSWRNLTLQNKGCSSFCNCVVCQKSFIFQLHLQEVF